MHKPVLLKQVLESLQDKQLSSFVDGTLGFAGHAEAILHTHPEITQFVGIDQDAYALQLAKERLCSFDDKVQFVQANFSTMDEHIKEQVDAILLDVGVSSMQLDTQSRGFSFKGDGPLDMRMDQSQALDAKTIVNTYPEKELARIFFEYGEVRGSRRLAKGLVEARKKTKITTTKQLSDILLPLMGYHPKRLHPMTLIFQALRIAVNDELAVLTQGLSVGFELLKPGGLFLVISFHSLEDRIVKNSFRKIAREDKRGILITKKPLIAEASEVKDNPRARSAKLRILEKI